MKTKNSPDAFQPDQVVSQDTSATEAEITTNAEPSAPAAAPANAATGMPIDQFHGRGGTYILRNGVRTLAD